MTNTKRQVTYWSISIFNSRTAQLNALALIVAVLSLTEVATVIPETWMDEVAALVAVINIILRTQTVRPASFIAPGTSTPVSVNRVGPPDPPATTD